jgi:hypothetical protein
VSTVARDAAGRARVPPRSRLVLVLLVGVLLRVGFVVIAPRHGYPWDHFDVLGMGVMASEHGFRVYSAPADALPTLKGWVVQNGRPLVIQRRCVHLPNYPPLAEAVFWLQSWWLGAGRPDFIANTPYTRAVTALVPWIFELATAIGVTLLATELTSAATLGFTAGSVMWLAPPLMLNTGLFGQYDALTLAPAVFALLAMLRGRWGGAGVAIGLGMLVKPQGLLLVPIATFAAAVGTAPDPARGVGAFARRLAAMGLAALATVVAGSAPWLLADGLAWVRSAYLMNHLLQSLPYTTLEAFNVWYVAGLLAERRPDFDVVSATATVAGLSRDAWGQLFLVTALAATAALCWRRLRDRAPLAVVVFAGLALWAVFIWPTRVHERYILYCVPPMLVAATALPRLRLVVTLLLVVATAEHAWMLARSGPPLGSFDRATVDRFHQERFEAYWKGRAVTMESATEGPKPDESAALAFARHRAHRRLPALVEWTLTLLSLGAYAEALRVVATTRADASTSDVIASA